MVLDPASAFAAGLHSSIKILEVCYSLTAVGEQTTDLLRTTEHVCRNINEAHRLRRLKASLIGVEEQAWMDAAIDDTEKALLEVAHLIEPARVDASNTHSISTRNKVLWVFRDSPKVKDKHNRLSLCHQTLIAVINVLYAKDVVVVAPLPADKPEDQPPPYTPEMEAIFNWRSMKRRKKSFTNLNPSITDPNSQSSRLASSDPLFLRPASERADSRLTHTYWELPSPRPGKPCNQDRLTTATPFSYYSSFEGADGLQVHDPQARIDPGTAFGQVAHTADQFPPPSELWSPVASLPRGSFSSRTVPNLDNPTHQTSVPVSDSVLQSSDDPQSRIDPGTAFWQAAQTVDQFPPSELWSPVALLPCGSFSSRSVSNYDDPAHQTSVPVSDSAFPSTENQSDIAQWVQSIGLADHAPGERNTPSLGRASTRSRGRQWLAHYASQNERG
jgi:hypothetical protein